MFSLPPFLEQEADEEAGGTVVHVTELTLDMRALPEEDESQYELDTVVPTTVERLKIGSWETYPLPLSFHLSSQCHSVLRWLTLFYVLLRDPISADHLPLGGTRLRGLVLQEIDTTTRTTTMITRDALSALLNVEKLVVVPSDIILEIQIINDIRAAVMGEGNAVVTAEDHEGGGRVVRRRRLASLSYMRYFALNSIDIDDNVAAARSLGQTLQYLPRLQVLRLGYGDLSAEAMEGIVDALFVTGTADCDSSNISFYERPPPLAQLRVFYLEYSDVSTVVAGRALGRLLQCMPRLEVLVLRGNYTNDETLGALLQCLVDSVPPPPQALLEHLRVLDLDYNWSITNAGAEQLLHVLQQQRDELEIEEDADIEEDEGAGEGDSDRVITDRTTTTTTRHRTRTATTANHCFLFAPRLEEVNLSHNSHLISHLPRDRCY